MKKITIVEDDPDLRGLLEVVLRNHPYDVEVFPTGEAFVQKYTGPSDLFLIDMNLGGISGAELCVQLKQQVATKYIPVIIISAHPELDQMSKDVCADDFLTKPFSRHTLVKLISKYI
jgi:DNA-binding response OmpR family regulator